MNILIAVGLRLIEIRKVPFYRYNQMSKSHDLSRIGMFRHLMKASEINEQMKTDLQLIQFLNPLDEARSVVLVAELQNTQQLLEARAKVLNFMKTHLLKCIAKEVSAANPGLWATPSNRISSFEQRLKRDQKKTKNNRNALDPASVSLSRSSKRKRRSILRQVEQIQELETPRSKRQHENPAQNEQYRYDLSGYASLDYPFSPLVNLNFGNQLAEEQPGKENKERQRQGNSNSSEDKANSTPFSLSDHLNIDIASDVYAPNSNHYSHRNDLSIVSVHEANNSSNESFRKF